MSSNYVVGVDIGGTHITAAIVDIANRKLIKGSRVRKNVDSKGTKEDILAVWIKAVKEVQTNSGYNVGKIAFAMPGPFDYTNGICRINGVDKYESLYGENIRNVFSDYFQIEPDLILFRNDAEAFLHGEVVVGGFNAADKILGFTLGTGFGSAFSHEGSTFDLSLGLLPFKSSIADDYLTTRWFRDKLRNRTSEIIGVQEISALAAEGDNLALSLFDEYADNLIEVLCSQLEDMQPTHLVFGGNISKAHAFFLPRTVQELSKKGLSPEFCLSKLGEQSAIMGSAYLFTSLFSVK